MGELACLVAPRKLVLINGGIDPIFPIKGTKEVYTVIEKIYKKEDVADNCRLVIMPERPHYFDRDVVFGTLKEVRK